MGLIDWFIKIFNDEILFDLNMNNLIENLKLTIQVAITVLVR